MGEFSTEPCPPRVSSTVFYSPGPTASLLASGQNSAKT